MNNRTVKILAWLLSGLFLVLVVGCNNASSQTNTSSIEKPNLSDATRPKDLPKEAPIIEGFVLESSNSTGSGGFIVNGDVAGSKESAVKKIKDSLDKQGWKNTQIASQDEQETILTSLHNRHSVQIHVVRESDFSTDVVIILSKS